VADAEDFNAHRDHLIAVAYRMLGSRADAEDAVQEAWLRYAGANVEEIADLRAWLTTVTGRICLDQLRSARVRREAYVGQWLPEPLVERLPAEPAVASGTPSGPQADPAERAVLAESVSIALLVLLESLNPEQRVAFVLHDVFALPFEEVADVLSTTPANARQLASRARRAVAAGEHRYSADRAEQAKVLAAFTAAASGGDLDALVALLAPDVVAIGDGGGIGPAARVPISGAAPVARFMLGLFRTLGTQPDALVEPVLVNGDLGLMFQTSLYAPPGEPVLRTVATFVVGRDGRVTAIYNQLNPEKLTRVPTVDRTRAVDPAALDAAALGAVTSPARDQPG
jgi:RNA polymerase sigma-70 factor, ECF subfamily